MDNVLHGYIACWLVTLISSIALLRDARERAIVASALGRAVLIGARQLESDPRGSSAALVSQ